MAIITSKATLKAAIADELHRGDLTDAIDIFIQSAEQRFQRDPRVRDPANNAVLVSLHTTDPNWLLTGHPDIYLYGALVESAPYLKDDARIEVWEQRYQDAAETLSGSVRLDPARALALTSYAELQTLVADALNRGDMKNVIPVLIVMAERRLHRDERVRNLETATFSITGNNLAAPTGFKELADWYYDGPTHYGTIEVVTAGQLGRFTRTYGPSGVPRFVAILDGVFRFAPPPDTTYSSKMTYWQGVTALASGANWLYTAHPDIYLYATLAEAKPWVRNDPTLVALINEAAAALEDRLEKLHLLTWNAQLGSTMRQHFEPIG